MTSQHTLTKILAPVLAVLMTACTAVGPTYQPPRTDMPGQWSENAGNVSVTAEAGIGRWWTQFNDPILNSLVSRAIATNQDLRIAETRIREARAVRRITAAGGLPRVGATGSFTRTRTGENTSLGEVDQDFLQAGFDMGWEIDIFGGIQRATEAAEASIAASEEERRDVLVSLVAEVARNYLELRTSQKRLALTKENISLQEQTVAMVKKRFQLGFSNQLALVQAETQLALTRAQAPGFETNARQTMHQLALLLGLTPESLVAELTPASGIPMLPPRIPVTLPSDLVRQRPDIRRAERQLAAATAEIGVATAELFPRFSLSAFLGQEGTKLSNLFASGSRFWTIGPKVNWSLFDGGKARAGIEASDSRRERAEILYEKTVLTAMAEVENALVALAREQETQQLLATAEAAAQRAFALAKNQYALGLVDFLNVLQSELAFSQAQDQRVQSAQRLCLHMIALYKALGGGWEPEPGAS